MKKKKIGLVIPAIALVFGMAVAGCSKGSGGGDGFTITGIPSEYNGKYAMLTGLAGLKPIVGYLSNENKLKLPRISNGKVNIPLWKDKDDGYSMKNIAKYSDSDTALGIAVNIYDSEDAKGDPLTSLAFALVKFSNGNATKSWSNGIKGK